MGRKCYLSSTTPSSKYNNISEFNYTLPSKYDDISEFGIRRYRMTLIDGILVMIARPVS